MFPQSETGKNLLLLKQQTRGGISGCFFFSTETRSSTARAHLAVLVAAAERIGNSHSQSAVPSRNHLQQKQYLFPSFAHIAQTQQSARSQALFFPQGLQQQHPCVITSFYRPERPTNQQIRQYVRRQQQRRKSTSQSPSSLADAKRINQDLVACKDAIQVLKVLRGLPVGALTKPAGGGVLNAVNLSTALNRLARHSAGRPEVRATVLQDPHFALLVAAIAEALDNNNNNRIVFKPQELSNIAWALAKLELPDGNDNSDTSSCLSERAHVLRQAVKQALTQQRQRYQEQGISDSSSTTPIESFTPMPALSQLSGHILDDIGNKVVAKTIAFSKNNRNPVSQHFKMQACANLLWAWATVDRADPVVMETVLQHMIHQQTKDLSIASTNAAADSMGLHPQVWSNSLWAFATARMYHGHEDLLDFVAHLLVAYPDFLGKFSAQAISNTVWATATLLVNKPEPLADREQIAALTIVRSAALYVLRKGTGSFNTQGLSNTIWSMATLGFGLSSSAEQILNSDSVVLESDDPAGDAEIMKKVLDVVVHAALRLLSRFQSQELSSLALSLARLVDVKTDTVDALLDGIGRQLQHPQSKVTSQDVSNTMWSLATLEHADDDLYRGLASRLTLQQAHTYEPQGLSMAVWSLATAKISLRDRDAFDTSLVPKPQRPSVRDPATAVFDIAARELMRRPHEFKPQEIKDVLWSFSKVGIRHPALFQSVAKHLVGDESDNGGHVASPARGLNEFSPQELSNLAYAFALQAQLSNDFSERMKGATSLVNSSGRLAVYKTACLDIGEQLFQRFFSAIAQNSTHLVQKAAPQALANTAWAFAVLGLKDVRFMEATQHEALERWARCVRGEVVSTIFNGQAVANFLWSHAVLNMPSRDLVTGLAPYVCSLCQDGKGGPVTVSSIARVFKRRELSNLAWSCAVFGEYPPELMNVLYTGLFGPPGKEQSPVELCEIHSDQGLSSENIISLIYVQAILVLAGSNQRLSLPDNFPDGWRQMGQAQHDDCMTDTVDELRLSTSKLQRAVSDALSRIGFKHVQEHVITMEEMSREHGISFSPKPIEILAIDIANTYDKIAIEVDGPTHFISCIDKSTTSSTGYPKRIKGKLEYYSTWNGDRQEINGATALKDRLLSSLGWKVIHIPFWEWNETGGDKSVEEEYCRGLFLQSSKSKL